MSRDWDWDCDCGWDLAEDVYSGAGSPSRIPPPPPPFFNIPPPPLPPGLASGSDGSSCYPAVDTCPSFMLNDPGSAAADGIPSMPVIAISAAILTAVIIIAVILVWRYGKQRKERRMERYQKALTASPGTMSNTDDVALYDELMSYTPNYRTPHASPPSYEMRDVVKCPCRCTTHPLLNNSHQYVASPYQQPQHEWNNTEPLYEELPSGPEDEPCLHNCHPNHNTNGPLYIEDGAEQPSRMYLSPSWYQNPKIRGQLTLDAPIKKGDGGVRAAWRELRTDPPDADPAAVSNPSKHRPRRKRQTLGSDTNGVTLYRGRCPPEPPPVYEGTEEMESFLDNSSTDATHNRSTIPRYYYYSENDDYGVCGGGPAGGDTLYRQKSLNDRRGSQRRVAGPTRTTTFSSTKRTQS